MQKVCTSVMQPPESLYLQAFQRGEKSWATHCEKLGNSLEKVGQLFAQSWPTFHAESANYFQQVGQM
ncbi:hypothetical protein HMPREF0658_0079 [Hoylesella marshii DSM 16973 = JCM 13450]|uniref:Uncharacterized protein n=1 Tax=Hoylesella marshii DSM 16973 = JCM 13450 TaxID=862515 RepID=E0NPH8_9BACT|nr:hypothetical protein HMPREF0658_0079 [Hoylesella marshii DSM 16973 = JCM 13450]